MKNNKQVIFCWGQKYTSSQLIAALHSNQGEFLELCRRVACDESRANELVELVKRYLESREGGKKSRTTITGQALRSIKLNLQELVRTDPKMTGNGFDIDPGTDEEINLIQLLAAVHMMAVTHEAQKR